MPDIKKYLNDRDWLQRAYLIAYVVEEEVISVVSQHNTLEYAENALARLSINKFPKDSVHIYKRNKKMPNGYEKYERD